MTSGPFPSIAAVAFGDAAEADRRVAGVAVAGRIVRELAESGFTEAWLTLPEGQALRTRTMADVNRLAGPMTVRIGEPVGGAQVARIDGGRAETTSDVLRRTGKATDGPVSRWLNRPISRALSTVLLAVPGVRPAHATLGTAALALAMFAVLVMGGGLSLVAGGLLFPAASIFDGVDGEVARATFRASPAGARLDTMVDVATTLLFVIGLTYNLASSGVEIALPLAAWGVALFALGLGLLAWRASRVGGSLDFLRVKRHYHGRFANVAAARFVAFATLVTSRDFFALFFAVLTVAGWPMLVLYLFAVAASVWILFVAGSVLPARAAA